MACDAFVALLGPKNRTVITFVNLACGINALILGAIKPKVSGALLTNRRLDITTLVTIRNRACRVTCAFFGGLVEKESIDASITAFDSAYNTSCTIRFLADSVFAFSCLVIEAESGLTD